MLKYKLTTQDNLTYNNTKWGENITHETNGERGLCGSGFLHYYDDPLLAVLLNSIHVDICNPKLWECEADGVHLNDRGLKGGCTKLTTLKEIPLPKITTIQRIAFGILCSKHVYKNPQWNLWADQWLSGEERSANAAAYAAAYTPNAAAYTPYAAAHAAANAAANAADAAAYAAANAADAAAYTAAGKSQLDFNIITIAKECLQYQ